MKSFAALAGCAATLLASLLPLGQSALSQTYPAKPVRIVVGYPPGGGNDLMARMVAEKLAASLGQQFVVDNKAGANGIIGTELAARAAPDGYTLLVAGSALSTNHTLYPSRSYDTLKDLQPISLIGYQPYFLVAHPGLPANNVKELIALAKARPSAINYASSGNGSIPHVSGELFNMLAGVKMTHVPYKGAGPAIMDLMAGQVQLLFIGLPSVLEYVKAGKLKLLGATSAKRSGLLPDLPTVGETLPGFEAGSWYGVLGPAKIPQAVQNRLAAEIAKAVHAKVLHERFVALGVEPASNTPEQFSSYLATDIERWAKVLKTAGVKVDQ
ncbi:MAG: tripartite tricarboxylate transporter substrate binding protein [Burkholderiaceae bacterium]